MTVKETIGTRRAYRSLDHIEVTEEVIHQLISAAQLSPSCFNNQPWRYIFVFSKVKLKEMHEALSKGNEWAKDASLYIIVCARKTDDCVIYDREYYLFDTGISTGFLILRATELGLVAHPIAGYSPKKTRDILNIPEDLKVISIIVVGKHATMIKPILSEKQQQQELKRPLRKQYSLFVHYNTYSEEEHNG
ncbi:MAG: nitroreductase family protein [Candidatus Thermoplasmatota archaeon]|nr:nitroreductase family protein [Candidatus Thermoplasmatota archaeon]